MNQMRTHLFDKNGDRIGADMGYDLQFIPFVDETLVLGTVFYVVTERSFHISTRHNTTEVHLILEVA